VVPPEHEKVIKMQAKTKLMSKQSDMFQTKKDTAVACNRIVKNVNPSEGVNFTLSASPEHPSDSKLNCSSRNNG
jgi:hypothetical protein